MINAVLNRQRPQKISFSENKNICYQFNPSLENYKIDEKQILSFNGKFLTFTENPLLMEISMDVYSLKLLKDGTTTSTIVRNSSLSYLEKLKTYKLVWIDHNDKVYLTERGHLAKKIGLKKFIELEKLEKKLVNIEPGELRTTKKGYIIIMFCLQIFLLLIGGYIIFG